VTVRVSEDGTIRLDGVCPIDDAETLLRLLLAAGEATVDWRGCVQAHSAVVQILLAIGPALVGQPTGDFLRRHIAPLLAAQASLSASPSPAILPSRPP
jgi:hypothetical protein